MDIPSTAHFVLEAVIWTDGITERRRLRTAHVEPELSVEIEFACEDKEDREDAIRRGAQALQAMGREPIARA